VGERVVVMAFVVGEKPELQVLAMDDCARPESGSLVYQKAVREYRQVKPDTPHISRYQAYED